MKPRNIAAGLAAACSMLVLILDTQTALSGIREGIGLCLNTLIPSLFPFFVLSIYMTGNLLGSDLRILRPLGRFCGIPDGAESLLVTGFLGGYPVGAQNAALAYEQGSLSRRDARRLLSFCSNAGPSFLFGVIGQAFDRPWICWAAWLIHMGSAILVGFIGRSRTEPMVVAPRQDPVTLPQALQKAITVMAQVSGWVILFRMLLHYLDRWFLWMLPGPVQVIFSGILELSNGCVRLRELESEGLRLMTATALVSIGGICVTMQTVSAVRGLSLSSYFPGKILQTVFSILAVNAVQLCLPEEERFLLSPAVASALCLMALIAVRFLRKTEKSSSFPQLIGV